MIRTKDEMIDTIKSRYAGVTQLSRTDSGHCDYSHETNGVGCAIGCLLPAELAKRVESEFTNRTVFNFLGPGSPYMTDYDAMNSESGRIVAEILKYIDVAEVGLDRLTTVQRQHDSSADVDEFMARLDTYKQGLAAND